MFLKVYCVKKKYLFAYSSVRLEDLTQRFSFYFSLFVKKKFKTNFLKIFFVVFFKSNFLLLKSYLLNFFFLIILIFFNFFYISFFYFSFTKLTLNSRSVTSKKNDNTVFFNKSDEFLIILLPYWIYYFIF